MVDSTGWETLDISWCITPSKYIYKYHTLFITSWFIVISIIAQL